MTKFKKVFKLMLDENQKEFNGFKLIHDKFINDKVRYRDQFNKEGSKIQLIIRRYENILCGRSEDAGLGNYTSKLTEKFWFEIKEILPEIDEIGVF